MTMWTSQTSSKFVKEYLPELYQDYGEVFLSADVNSERREIDLFLFQQNQCQQGHKRKKRLIYCLYPFSSSAIIDGY